MKKSSILALTCILVFSMRIGARLNLDDSDVRKHVTYLRNHEKNELTISVKNIIVECTTGSRHDYKLIGTYPNPNYKPYIEGFKVGGQSPYCLVYFTG